jgi:Flp pilus assembly protein TadG
VEKAAADRRDRRNPVPPIEGEEVAMASKRPSERGAVAVEFALLLPLLMVLVFGVIDFGRLFNAQVSVTQAAREGARLAALGYTNSAVISRTTAAAPALSGLTVTVTPCAAGATQTTDAVVVVRYTLTFSTPMVGLVGLPTTKVLTGTGHMPCQG